MMHRISADTADALAALAVSMRPEWDRPGVIAALRAVYARGDAHAVIDATLRAVRDLGALTPAAIGFEQYWPPPPERDGEPPRCPKLGHGSYYAHNCGACRVEHIEPGAAPPEHFTPAPRPASTRRRGSSSQEES